MWFVFLRSLFGASVGGESANLGQPGTGAGHSDHATDALQTQGFSGLSDFKLWESGTSSMFDCFSKDET